MRPQLPPLAAVVATVLLLFSSPSFARNIVPHSIIVERASVSRSATAVFGCETRFFDRNLNDGRVACYGPSAIRAAYGLTKLIKTYGGKGQTIVILDAFGSPTALQDLQAFDAAFGLPDPPSFRVITMLGTPPFDENNDNHIMWAQEVSLDVQWAHAIAPGADIVLVAAASNSDDDMLKGLNYAIDNRLGQVISMSFGESEAFLTDRDGQQMVRNWERAFTRARERRITLLASSGDQGSTNAADDAGNIFPFRNVSYPASSPQVTAVGGTNLFFGDGKTGQADPNGKYLGETVWNDQPQGIAGAGGGGVSALFSRPGYQNQLPSSVRRSLSMRGIPDLAYNAGVVGGVVVHLGFGPFDGFFIFGGTSAGAPQWAGIMADLNQALARPLGFINERLYKLGQGGKREREQHERDDRDRARLFHDITVGDNGFCFFITPSADFGCVPGFQATPGWDLATGWGTPSFGSLMTLFDQWKDDNDDDD